MNPDDIKTGRFYRDEGGGVVWYVLHRWRDSVDALMVRQTTAPPRVQPQIVPVDMFATWVDCEVEAQFTDAERGFLAGMMA